uniref:Viral interleukin-10 homolog n=1 Tax=Pseudocowpox virus TaxID=129726 RepID=Q52T63_9POXV|nr:interleukin 10-like [Pseudocowpox virus]
MIQFYLEEVMPQAENHGPDIKEHVNSLGEKLRNAASSTASLPPLPAV